MLATLERFGTLALPTYNRTHRVGADSRPSVLLKLPGGGVYDVYNTERAPANAPLFEIPCSLVADSPTDLQEQLRLLDVIVGTRDVLYARRPDNTVIWRYARLEEDPADRKWNDILTLDLKLRIQALGQDWYGTSHADDVKYYLTDAAPATNAAVIVNGGDKTNNSPILSLYASGSAITQFTITVASLSSFTWSGTLAATKNLVINCGAPTVKNDGADAYAGFSLSTGAHFIDDWLRLMAASTTLTITRTGGDGGSYISVSFADAWY